MLGFTAVFISLVICSIYFRKRFRNRTSNLKGKLALVTGGANGLGQQICIELAKLGCNIVIADVDFVSAKKTEKSLENFGISAVSYKVDVSNFEEIKKLKKDILNDVGEVDILINNAGIIAYKTIFEQSADDIERLIRVNVNSVILMTKCFLENMIKRKSGHIVTISSLQGIYANSCSVTYCATKFGCYGFMSALKVFLRHQKLNSIYTTTILPNLIATRTDLIESINPNLHFLEPKEVAKSTISAIINKNSVVSVPEYFQIGINFFNLLPFWMQHIIRDLRGESNFLTKNT